MNSCGPGVKELVGADKEMDRKNEIAFFFDDNQSTFYRKNSTAGGLKPPPSMKH